MTTPPAAPPETLVVEFEGWYQYRLPTDPDPTDETRGSSGYTFAFGDEPDLDRILRFQPDPAIPVRTHGPPIGVHVTRATKLIPAGDQDLPGLVGATVDLLGKPMLLNRNWVLTLPGYEPISPFHLEVKTDGLRISREAPLTVPGTPPAASHQPIQDVPESTLTLYGASGLAYEPDTVAPAIGVWDPLQQYVDRLALLTADREAARQAGALPDGPELAVLDGRIAQLQIALRQSPGSDRRTGVRHVIERFGFPCWGRSTSPGTRPACSAVSWIRARRSGASIFGWVGGTRTPSAPSSAARCRKFLMPPPTPAAQRRKERHGRQPQGPESTAPPAHRRHLAARRPPGVRGPRDLQGGTGQAAERASRARS